MCQAVALGIYYRIKGIKDKSPSLMKSTVWRIRNIKEGERKEKGVNWREKGMKEGNFSDKYDEVVKMGKCIT